MKLSKSTLITYFIIGILILAQFFFLSPYVKGKYSYNDIQLFKKESWLYSFILPFLLFLFLIIIGWRKKMIVKTYGLYFFILFIFVSFYSKRLTDDILLYFNTKIKVEKISKDYIVSRNDENKVFHLYDNKSEFILSNELLNKIDSLRFKRNLKSLYQLKNNDIIKVEYEIGFLKVKYLE